MNEEIAFVFFENSSLDGGFLVFVKIPRAILFIFHGISLNVLWNKNKSILKQRNLFFHLFYDLY